MANKSLQAESGRIMENDPNYRLMTYEQYVAEQKGIGTEYANDRVEKRAYSIDLQCIYDKAIEEHRWKPIKAINIAHEYRRFLIMSARELETIPPIDIDRFWHLHILDTKKYEEDCEFIFGYFLHHAPEYGNEDYEDGFNLTLDLYRDIFKEEPPKRIWK